LSDSFPEYVSSLYATFVATNSIPLQAEGGGACYPFANAVQDLLPSTAYAESALPQCQKPNSTDGYCAFAFEDSNANFTDYAQCEGRRYNMTTFASENAVPSTASITHKGPCGVCSSAQDWSISIVRRDEMFKVAYSCGTIYYTGGKSFDRLVTCFQYAGFTKDCATLWAHYSATSGELCVNECLGGDSQLNGDPPECALGECGACGEQFKPEFDIISGRTTSNSGFTEPLAHSCSDFYPVIHDPCPLVQKDPTHTPVLTATVSNAAAHCVTSAAITMLLPLIGW
jgi:hypothetical protein